MAVLKQFCCGFSLQTGTIVIALLYLVLLATREQPHIRYFQQFVHRVESRRSQLIHMEQNSRELKVAFGSVFIQAICGIFLLFGATLEIAGLLLQWIIVETLDLVVMTAISIITCFFLIAFAREATVGLIGIACVIISSLFGTYCLMVVYSYYQTLLENERTNVVNEMWMQSVSFSSHYFSETSLVKYLQNPLLFFYA